MIRKKIGRGKDRKTKGWFFRSGRGWFTKIDGKFIPLCDEYGAKLKEKKTLEPVLKRARETALEQARRATPPEPLAADMTVEEVCKLYLDDLRKSAKLTPEKLKKPVGIAKTYIDRGQTLFDFCYGMPGKFFCKGDTESRPTLDEQEPHRIHPGYGHLLCSELTPLHIDAWIDAHNWTPSGTRTRVQAVKRAMNFAVGKQVLTRSPTRGIKIARAAGRVTYLTPDQEKALIEVSTPEFALALKVCIRTGARFGREFASLQVRHIDDQGERMQWVFKAGESKTGKGRIIRISDPEIIQLTREHAAKSKDGYVFHNAVGNPWTRHMLSQNFRRAKAKAQKKGVRLDEDACMYSCRHTYAKRTLEGYWTGVPTSIKTLSRLMGNSVETCIKHYLRFDPADNELLWGSA